MDQPDSVKKLEQKEKVEPKPQIQQQQQQEQKQEQTQQIQQQEQKQQIQQQEEKQEIEEPDVNQLSASISKMFAIIFLRAFDGSRIYSKYYTQHFPKATLKTNDGMLTDIQAQKAFEQNIWSKGKRIGARLSKPTETEIFQYAQFNVVMKQLNEACLYVVADYEENEILLSQVITALYDSLAHITKDNVSRKVLLEQFDQLIIVVDEIIDEGIIVTLDPQVIVARTQMKDCDGIYLDKQEEKQSQGGFASIFAKAKQTFASSFFGS